MKDGTPIYNTNSGYKGDENQEAEILVVIHVFTSWLIISIKT